MRDKNKFEIDRLNKSLVIIALSLKISIEKIKTNKNVFMQL